MSKRSMEILPDSRSRSWNNAENMEDFPLFVCQRLVYLSLRIICLPVLPQMPTFCPETVDHEAVHSLPEQDLQT
jgi:hypothetical protein